MQPSLSKIKDYPKFLNDHWALHLAPRAKDAPTVISTFAGCGGSSLGYSFAGYKELLAVEWDRNAVDTFKLNFPDVPVYHGDIAELSVDQCLEMTGLKVGELDVLDGSPPCQGFSTAGKRVMQDSRNFLFREYARLLKGLQPRVFVMENVSGMVKGKMKLIFAEILRELKACGYKVKAVLMNAMYFGVPQSRQRMIFIGTRNDVNSEPSHPLANFHTVSVMTALKDVINATFNRGLATVATAIWNNTKPGQNGTVYRKNYYMNTVKVNPDRPAPTLLCSGTGSTLHWQEARTLTIEEAKRCASFPDAFIFQGKFIEQWARIGNSVPPLFMKAIAEHIRINILDIEIKRVEDAKKATG